MSLEKKKENKVSLFLLLILFVLFMVLRWPGALPYGSDSDEHLLVAKTMLKTGHFSVLGIHGTKDPPIISSIALFFSLFSTNVGLLMILANWCFILIAGIFWYRFGKERYNPLFGLIAALYLISNLVVGDASHQIISDPLFILCVTVCVIFHYNLKNGIGSILYLLQWL